MNYTSFHSLAKSPVSILLVDDDDVDAMALMREFKKHDMSQLTHPIYRAKDGIEALIMLRGSGEHHPIPSPFIILLDLKLPRMSGLEFLEELRQDPHLRRSIVFVHTTSREPEDKVAAYEMNVSGYILKTKPADNEIPDVVTMLEEYCNLVKFP